MPGTRISRRSVLSATGAGVAGLCAGGFGAARAQDQAAVAAPPVVGPIEVAARAIPAFDRAGKGQTKFGALEFRGGLELTSATREFGGWSGLAIAEDGRKFIAVSDQGSWLTAELVYDGTKPQTVRGAVLGSIPGAGGKPLDRKRDADAEAITLLDGTLTRGTVLVSFERNHRIGRYPVSERGLGPPLGFLKLPAEARRMRANAGFEAVGVIRGGAMKGSVIAFAEELHDPRRNHTGWIWPGGIGGEPQRLGLVNIGDFAITDVASLPDGSLIVLERRFRWLEGVQMRLRLVKAATVRPGALLDGEVLLQADMAYQIDNMECLGLHRGLRGETILTLMSDDNFNHFLQRTLLLQFALTDAR